MRNNQLENYQNPNIFDDHPIRSQLSGQLDKPIHVEADNQALSIHTSDITIHERHEGLWVDVSTRHSRIVGRLYECRFD